MLRNGNEELKKYRPVVQTWHFALVGRSHNHFGALGRGHFLSEKTHKLPNMTSIIHSGNPNKRDPSRNVLDPKNRYPRTEVSLPKTKTKISDLMRKKTTTNLPIASPLDTSLFTIYSIFFKL